MSKAVDFVKLSRGFTLLMMSIALNSSSKNAQPGKRLVRQSGTYEMNRFMCKYSSASDHSTNCSNGDWFLVLESVRWSMKLFLALSYLFIVCSGFGVLVERYSFVIGH